MTDDGYILKNFGGIARLFPLPNVVLFPQVVQPLHIFEPRYRQMTADALADDRLIAPVLLRPGWEADYEGRPGMHSMLCLGRIVAEQRLADGRYNLLLRGLSRCRIVEELPAEKLYRCARLELLAESNALGAADACQLRQRIGQVVHPWLPLQGPGVEQLNKVLQSDLAIGVLCDLLGFALPLGMELKQQLLEELDVAKRAQTLIQHLQCTKPPKAPGREDQKYPPEFSSN